jgi:ABC-type multidrug transport system ATPase subunit
LFEGKTTLLNVLNFRSRKNLEISGMVKVNGEQAKSIDDMTSISGYVQQDEAFFGTLTVRETLAFQVLTF